MRDNPQNTGGAGKAEFHALWYVFLVAVLGLLMAMSVSKYTISLNNRVDRQRDFLCAKYADADATLRDCPKDTLPERIEQLRRELERLLAQKEKP